MTKKNYNLDALTGGDTDDMELCVQYGLNPDFAYTPMINDEMFKAVNKSSVRDMIKAGYSEEEAIKEANAYTAQAKERLSDILKEAK